jgi:hypothetical protein
VKSVTPMIKTVVINIRLSLLATTLCRECSFNEILRLFAAYERSTRDFSPQLIPKSSSFAKVYTP